MARQVMASHAFLRVAPTWTAQLLENTLGPLQAKETKPIGRKRTHCSQDSQTREACSSVEWKRAGSTSDASAALSAASQSKTSFQARPQEVIWVKTPSEHPFFPTNLGSKMGGAPTPKWDPIGFDPQPYYAILLASGFRDARTLRNSRSSQPGSTSLSDGGTFWPAVLLQKAKCQKIGSMQLISAKTRLSANKKQVQCQTACSL